MSQLASFSDIFLRLAAKKDQQRVKRADPRFQALSIVMNPPGSQAG